VLRLGKRGLLLGAHSGTGLLYDDEQEVLSVACRVLRNLEDPPWSLLGALPEGWEGTPWGERVDAEHKPSWGGGGYPRGGRSYVPGGWVGGHGAPLGEVI